MDTLAQIATVLAVSAAAITLLTAISLRLRWRGRGAGAPSGEPVATHYSHVLGDSRSFLQGALEVFDAAIPHAESPAPAQRNARQLVHLLQASPSLVFSEIVDDRALLAIEQSTSARRIWIVMTEDSIEFEYPAAAITFSEVVFENLRRGVDYRYLVVPTDGARERAHEVVELIRNHGFDDRLQIRLLSRRFWERLSGSADGMIAFEAEDGSGELFYLFPDPTPDAVRRWVKAPTEESRARICDLEATWETAEPVDGETT